MFDISHFVGPVFTTQSKEIGMVLAQQVFSSNSKKSTVNCTILEFII